MPLAARGDAREPRWTARRHRGTLRAERVNALLGTTLIDERDRSAYLAPIGFDVRDDRGRPRRRGAVVPPDATREVDLIEEVARHHGYERIGRTERRSPRVGALTSHQARRRRLLRALSGAVRTRPGRARSSTRAPKPRSGSAGRLVEVLNPIVRGETVLRTRLLAGLLGALATTSRTGTTPSASSRSGSVFGASDTDEPTDRG